MHVLTFIIWVVSLAFLGIAAFWPKPTPANVTAVGLFAFDLWIGLQFLLEVTDPITF